MKSLVKEVKRKLLGETLRRNPFSNSKYGNLRCFCGSGSKLKRCHGSKVTLDKSEMDEARKLFEKWEESPEGLKFFQEKRGQK